MPPKNISHLPAAKQKVIIATHNTNTSKHFAAFLSSYILFFVLFRVVYLLARNYGRSNPKAVAFCAFPTRLM
jgi:hypothetical protein